MQIERININNIVEYENNAKQHPQWQIEQIARSIEEFGFNDPLAIDEDNMIIEGHGRYLALKHLGYEEVNCIRLTNLTEEQKRAYILAHNKLTLNTDFDLDKLEYELNALKVSDFDISVTGFSEEDLEDMERLDEETDIEDEEYNSNFNITIQCESTEEAEKLNKALKLNLDLTRQVLKVKFKDISL